MEDESNSSDDVAILMPNEEEELKKEVDEVLAAVVSVSAVEHFSTLVNELVEDVVRNCFIFTTTSSN